MQSKALTIKQYLEELPDDRKEVMNQLHKAIVKNLSAGFEAIMNYGMISYVVPHSLYPAGYHCKPSDPLPFMSLASQKNHISVYHMGVYAEQKLMDWLKKEYPKYSNRKLDIGKSCLRFKNPEDVPVKLIGELAAKISVKKWIELYESQLKMARKKS